MKKTILSFAVTALFAVAAVSCATHTTYRSYSDTQPLPASQGEWQKCAVCDGKGGCSACSGTGKISGDACRRCKGTGKCTTCNGNGGYYVN